MGTPGKCPWWVKRQGSVYEVTTIHEQTGRLVRGYRGKTRKRPYTKRIAEHRATQPWGDLIVSHRVLASGQWNDLQLWWAEAWRIVLGFPVYNYHWNRLCPRRIPIYVAAERHRSAACREALRRGQLAMQAGRAVDAAVIGMSRISDAFRPPAVPRGGGGRVA